MVLSQQQPKRVKWHAGGEEASAGKNNKICLHACAEMVHRFSNRYSTETKFNTGATTF
jgi:hypothetical protein